MKIYNKKGELISSVTEAQARVILEDIKDTLLSLLDTQEKSLFILGELEKHQSDITALEIDPDEVEEKINDIMVNVDE